MTVTVGEGEENLDVDFPLTVPPAPTPDTPATTVAKVLARTGSDASVLGGMAAMAAIAGSRLWRVSAAASGRAPNP